MNVCVIGGGASGLVSAIFAAEAGANVRILELRDRVGKKILATGNGKCNMTNADQSLSHYHGLKSEEDSRSLVDAVFHKFSPNDTIDFFEKLGISVIYKNGYAYPRSEQASSVNDVLRFRLDALSVDTVCSCMVSKITKDNNEFIIQTSNGVYKADKVILACGSRASLADNISDGYKLASALGHKIIKPLPALVPIICSDSIFKSLSGIRTKGKISVFDEHDKLLASDEGELQLNSYGVSGIPSFMVSYVLSKHLNEHKKAYLLLDFMPDMGMDELAAYLKNRITDCPYKLMDTFLIGLLNKNLSNAIIKECGIDSKLNVNKLTDKDIQIIASHIKEFRANAEGTKSYKDAQICAGGVDVSELNTNLESRIVQNLYFAGEMIDVHGDCGGYNLQWAFSSGALCGMNSK